MNNNLKICLITPAYFPAISYGGPINSVKLIAEELVKLGNKVSVFTSAFGLDENKSKKEIINRVEVYYFKYFIFKRWIISFSLLKELWKQRNNFDIFHINLIWDPISWLSGFLLSLSERKIIISPRGTVEKELIRGHNYFLKKIVYYLFLRFIFNKTTGFHFSSQREREKFFEFTKINKNFKIVYNPFYFEEFDKKIDKNLLKKFNLLDKRYILYFGRISWKKRIELLIEAFNELTKEIKDFYLAIIGSSEKDYFERLKKKIEAFNLDDKVILFGETIYGDEKIVLYQNAHFFVLPSISENFGYVVLEALASRVPVIVSDGVALKDIVEKYKVGLVFKDKTELVSEMKNLTNENFYNQLKKNLENSLELIKEEFLLQKLAKEILSFYLSLL